MSDFPPPFRRSSEDFALRRAAFGLTSADERDLDRIRLSIREELPALLEAFYANLLPGPSHLASPRVVERLRREQRNYLMTLGYDSGSEAYFRSRIRVALMHRRVGVSQGSYLGAHSHLFGVIGRRLSRLCPGEDLVPVLATLQRALAFDSYVIVQAYARAAQRRFRGSLERLSESRRVAVEHARLDNVTQIDSREFLLAALAVEFERSSSSREPFSLLFIDIDHFKAVNDAHGHAAGDEVLRSVVATIKKSLRPLDIVGRYGGDEFLVGLVGSNAPAAQVIAERLCHGVMTERVTDGPRITVSIGCATRTMEASVIEMIRSADRAMYAAKVSGRNKVVPGAS